MSKTPGLDRSGLRLSQVALDLDLHDAFAARAQTHSPTSACIWMRSKATGTLFVRRDETEAAWQWVDGILDGWSASRQAAEALPRRHLGPERGGRR